MKNLEEMVDLVVARLTKKEKLAKPISYYGIANRLRDELGVKITQNGLLSYKEPESKSMRWDVMAGLQTLGGLTDKEVMDFVRQSLPKGKK